MVPFSQVSRWCSFFFLFHSAKSCFLFREFIRIPVHGPSPTWIGGKIRNPSCPPRAVAEAVRAATRPARGASDEHGNDRAVAMDTGSIGRGRTRCSGIHALCSRPAACLPVVSSAAAHVQRGRAGRRRDGDAIDRSRRRACFSA